MKRRTFKPFSFVANNKQVRRSTLRKSGSIGFEPLEKREVMAANITAAWAGTVLTIEGTPGDDVITVYNDGAYVSIQGSTTARGEMGMAFPRSLVSSIKVDALAGKDTIEMVEMGVGVAKPIAMTVKGGWGDDTIKGGSGSDELYGNGALNDQTSGPTAAALDKGFAFNETAGVQIYNLAGRGEKWFLGGNGWNFITPDGGVFGGVAPSMAHMYMNGMIQPSRMAQLDSSFWADPNKLLNASVLFTDMDTIDGKNGVDYIYGGADVDMLIGGHGNDVIEGNAGDDTIWGGVSGNTTQWPANDADRIWGNAGDDTMFGGGDFDRIWGDVGKDIISGDDGNDALFGGTEDDTLFGDRGNDELWGGYGIDELWGGADNDRLYGEMGYDYLYGEGGDDILDAGAANESVSGGVNSNGAPERDVNLWVTKVSNAIYDDIRQAGGTQTCWILSSMGAVSRYEDLSQRITYLGNNLYKVNLYNRKDINNIGAGFGYQPVYVTFDGTRISSDPLFNNQEGETWMIIMQRAIIQAVSKFDPTQTLQNPHSGGALDPLSILTGKWGEQKTPAQIGSLTALSNLLISGKRIVVHAKNSGTTVLPSFHAYTLLSVSSTGATVYDPAGVFRTVSWSTILSDVGAFHYV